MSPGFKVPADTEVPPVGIRKLMDDEIVFEGFNMAYGRPIDVRHLETPRG